MAEELESNEAPPEVDPLEGVEVVPLDLSGPGYLRNYRKVILLKEAYADFARTTIEKLDEAEGFLLEHIVVPSAPKKKREVLDRLEQGDVVRLFGMIIGGDRAVPPQKGGVSAASSA